MKALTVQQPWAWAIFHGKNIENRTQLWKYRGPLAIHAGKRWSERGEHSALVRERLRDSVAWPKGVALGGRFPRWPFEMGAIIGTADLVDSHPESGCCTPWGESSYVEHGGRERRHIVHLVLENPRLIDKPIPCRGALGLWTPPADIIDELEEVTANV